MQERCIGIYKQTIVADDYGSACSNLILILNSFFVCILFLFHSFLVCLLTLQFLLFLSLHTIFFNSFGIVWPAFKYMVCQRGEFEVTPEKKMEIMIKKYIFLIKSFTVRKLKHISRNICVCIVMLSMQTWDVLFFQFVKVFNHFLLESSMIH